MKNNSQFVAVTILFYLMFFVLSFAQSMTNDSFSRAHQCSDSHQSLRWCTGGHWGGNPEEAIALTLCQDKNAPEKGYIILVAKNKETELVYQNVSSGSIVMDKHNNINFLTKTQISTYSILFTNDGDEAYVTNLKNQNGDFVGTGTLYCQ